MTPDEHGNWINQRNKSFETFLAIGHKKNHGKKLFETFFLVFQPIVMLGPIIQVVKT
ncbi:putative helicase [Bartonella silvatica]|uniref:Helicase n=1 Tax=Bartonella silvatica TaxID=357760 RepID=A0ABV2HF46_9HYPH